MNMSRYVRHSIDSEAILAEPHRYSIETIEETRQENDLLKNDMLKNPRLVELPPQLNFSEAINKLKEYDLNFNEILAMKYRYQLPRPGI